MTHLGAQKNFFRMHLGVSKKNLGAQKNFFRMHLGNPNPPPNWE